MSLRKPDHKRLRNLRKPWITPDGRSAGRRPLEDDRANDRGLAAGSLAIGTAAALGAALAGARFAAKRFTTPAPNEEKFITPWELDIPHEDVSFPTEDGLTLRGWWLPREGAKHTVVTMAGYNGARHHTLGISSALWRRGSNVLLFDNRGRGQSEGDLVSLGHFERLDALAATEYASSRDPGLPLGMLGFSMGGAAALMAAAADKRIRAVVADSPFASQKELVHHHLRRRVGISSAIVLALSSQFLHYDIREVEPIRSVKDISGACMFIHGGLDDVTDPEDSIEMHKAAGEPKELWLVEGAGHIEAYFLDREEYSRRVSAFFDERLA